MTIPPRLDERPTALGGHSGNVILTMLNGPECGRVIRVSTLPCRLGRGGTSQIVIVDRDDPPGISREHATLETVDGALVLRDHSVNGTRVSSRWLQHGEAAQLELGDELQLGPSLVMRLLESAISMPTNIASEHATKGADSVRGTGSLRSMVTSPDTLAAAWRRVELNRGAAGPDNVTIAEFTKDAPRRLDALRDLLVRNRYQPLPPRLFAAPKRSGGVRKIAILSISDRVVQNALHMTLQPIIEPHLSECCYSYRPGVSAHHALRSIDALLQRGFTWIAETDIADFFDSIAHRVLLDKLAATVSDSFVLSLVSRCLAAGASEAGCGIAQGAALSPLLSNLYLSEFDMHMSASSWNPVRYGDDVVFMAATRGQAEEALAEASGFLQSRLRLALRPDKTRIAPLAKGFTFLGYHFTEAGRRASPQSVARLRERLEEAAPSQATAVLRGWTNYFNDRTMEVGGALQSQMDDEHLDRFIRLFGGRENVHARQGESGFVPTSGGLTRELIQAHLAGSVTLAAYLVRQSGGVQAVVMDIDAKSPAAKGEEQADAVAGFAKDLERVCRRFGVPASLEDSGRRGRHLWIFFSEAVPTERARRLARLLSISAGFPRPGLRLEILPRHSDWPGPDLGDAVKLPFGVHPATGRRCHFLRDEEPIVRPEDAIDNVITFKADQLEAVIASLKKDVRTTADIDERSESANEVISSRSKGTDAAVVDLVSGCAVVRALIKRAQTTGHLRHTHNLILLYTAGRLGEPGAEFVHRTVAQCRNYDARICQKYLDQLDRQHAPLSCRRIREWLEEEGEAGLCTCPASRRTPLDFQLNQPNPEVQVQVPARSKRPQSAQHVLPSDADAELRQAWQGVVDDLFGEPTAPIDGGGAPTGSAATSEETL